METSLVNLIASALEAAENCKRHDNADWFSKHMGAIETLVRDYLPSGSGFDNGTQIDLVASKPDKLIFETGFHHMTEGTYDGWTHHRVTVTPSFVFGVNVAVSGRNRNDIKDFIAETFHEALATPVERPAGY